jgi:hypothetical protein
VRAGGMHNPEGRRAGHGPIVSRVWIPPYVVSGARIPPYVVSGVRIAIRRTRYPPGLNPRLLALRVPSKPAGGGMESSRAAEVRRGPGAPPSRRLCFCRQGGNPRIPPSPHTRFSGRKNPPRALSFPRFFEEKTRKGWEGVI